MTLQKYYGILSPIIHLTDQEVTRLKKVILNGGNKLIKLVSLSAIVLKVIIFKKVN